jgi:hypothetical protein
MCCEVPAHLDTGYSFAYTVNLLTVLRQALTPYLAEP